LFQEKIYRRAYWWGDARKSFKESVFAKMDVSRNEDKQNSLILL